MARSEVVEVGKKVLSRSMMANASSTLTLTLVQTVTQTVSIQLPRLCATKIRSINSSLGYFIYISNINFIVKVITLVLYNNYYFTITILFLKIVILSNYYFTIYIYSFYIINRIYIL
jgi:hypothetical protein